ncbi:MAG: choice-of-anchor R domain-containing protein [Bryobacteraceae bacterium]
MQQKQSYPRAQLALAFCVCCLPSMASVLFSDLGGAGDVYSVGPGYTLSGSGFLGTSETDADLFPVAGIGGQSVTEIDLAVINIFAPDTFSAAIWTDVGNAPGTQVAGAFWDLSTTASSGTCCSLVSVTGISGVTLTGGQEYFMVLSPLSLTDDSWNVWDQNNQGVDNLVLSSTNGGSSWTSSGSSPLGAFDVLSDPTAAPEPGSWFMLAAGIAAIAMRARYRLASQIIPLTPESSR